MLAAIYARVSTQRQENEETIETQIMAINDFASKNGHTVVKEYRDDGWSGMILARPSLDELRLDVRNKVWESVIVYDPDRIARKYSYQALVIDELEEAGIKVLFVTTPPAKTDEDKLLYGVKGLFAEYERARSADRFRLGKLRKAREGNVVTSKAPYGYVYVPKQGNKQGYYRINEQEARVAKMIFEWVANEGLTIRKVVRRLHSLGITPRRSARGVWNTSTLTTMLRNETYIGQAHYNKSYGVVPEKPIKNEKYKRIKKTSRKYRDRNDWIFIEVPAIIDEELFKCTRKQLKDNYELCKRNRHNEYLLAGKIYCVCGRKRGGEGPQRGKHLYYRCRDREYSFPLPPKCRERGINARIADELVWERVAGYMRSPGLIEKQAKRWMDRKADKVKNVHGSVEKLQGELREVKAEEQRYIKAYGAEMISLEQLEEVMKDIKIKKQAVQRQIGYLEKSSGNDGFVIPSEGEIDKFCKKASEVLENLSFEKKRAILMKVTDRIIGSQEKLTVYGYLPVGGVEDVKFWSDRRDSGVGECGEEHAV